MRITIEEARGLVVAVMTAQGQRAEDAAIIADHIIDCELRGLAYGGLARVVSIVERLQRTGPPTGPVEVAHETPVSARLRGNDNLGYVVAHKATEIAIDKAKAMGLALVGADGTWYTGMLSVFAEMAAEAGLITMIASNATPWVAPHGATEGRFGTNPICFGFPSTADPVIWDIGTSSIMHAEVMLAQRHDGQIPAGKAFDAQGHPTTDPAAALAGAFTPWGGHKGSGLGHVVQLLGILAGSPIQPPELAEFGYLIVTMKPDLLMAEADYRARVTDYAEAV
ncbi:MAG: Ldh family oxidoreductase, partial [Rhodospirillaceae bacterium]|nr:Ldh family oxidoreductase [Rhodospirillaceae bacterium]